MKLYRVTETWDDETSSFILTDESTVRLLRKRTEPKTKVEEISPESVSSQHLAEMLDSAAENWNFHHLNGAYSEIRQFILEAAQKHIILTDPDKSSNILMAELIAKQVMWDIAQIGGWL